MSLDYTTVETARSGNVAPAAIINGTYLPPGVTLYSKNYDWLCLGFNIRVIAAPTSATQYVTLEMSDSAGSFASPTELGRRTFLSASGATALTTTVISVADASVRIQPGYLVRLVHIATSTDATLNYDYEIIATTRNN